MAATANYQAGIEANQTRISYLVEATWGVAPTNKAFQAIRYMSDTLAETKTRQRPNEINITREASQAVTTQQTAGGTINYALSYSVFDDFFSIVLQRDWPNPASVIATGTDITWTVTTPGTNAVVTMTSITPSKFTALAQGTWVRIFGMTNAVNNGWWYIKVAGALSVTLDGPQRTVAVAEVPTTGNPKIRYSSISNGVTFKSMFMQQSLSPSLFLVYPGTYVTRMTVSGSIGNFFTGAIDIVAKDEDNLTTDSSVFGPVIPAPNNTVMDPVSGFVGCFWNGQPMVGAIDQMAFTLENQGAAPEYALGSQLAVGILSGTFSANGTFRMYFNDFVNYNLFTTETLGALTFIVQGNTGNSYAFTFPQAFMMVKMNAGGPGQPVFAEVTFEANPNPTTTGGTVIIDRLPNA